MSSTITEVGWLKSFGETDVTEQVPALTIAWSLAQPHRIGETALLLPSDVPLMLGRGDPASSSDPNRVRFFQQRPGQSMVTEPLLGRGLSRNQLRVTVEADGLHVKRVGRCELRINGEPREEGEVHPGDTILLRHQLLLLCTLRPWRMEARHFLRREQYPEFGLADPHGQVGESPVMWDLRDQLAFIAKRDAHVLVLGDSGTGKELAAQAIHGLSTRQERPFISRNAATFPDTLIDAELFGNIKDYPNPGMRDRPGLIGAADGSTLFLDEIGELPPDLQAHLLRVLDADGSYQRLGESTPREADIRLVAATNRDPAELKHDLRSRLTLQLQLPGLNGRSEDIPLLAQYLLRRYAQKDHDLGERFFEQWYGETGVPRIDPKLMDRLLRHHYTSHVRELELMLWDAIATSKGNYLALSDDLIGRLKQDVTPGQARPDPSPEEIQACLDLHGGNQARVWKELGLRNRHVLYRLIKKHGLQVSRDFSADGNG